MQISFQLYSIIYGTSLTSDKNVVLVSQIFFRYIAISRRFYFLILLEIYFSSQDRYDEA